MRSKKPDGSCLYTVTHKDITKVLLAEHFQDCVLNGVVNPTDRNSSAIMDSDTAVEIPI